MADGVNLGSAYAQIDLDLSPLQRAVRDAQRPLNQLDRSLDSVGKSGQQSARLLDLSSASMDKAGRSAQGTVASLRATNQGAGQLRGGLSSLTAAIGGSTVALGAATAGVAALGAGLVAAVGTAARFEQAMANVGAVSNATDEQLMRLSEAAKEMGRTTSFSATQAAEGLGFLAMAGFDVDQQISALPGTLNLAAAGNLDLADSADIASNVLTGMGLAAEDMTMVADVMAKTITTSNTNVRQLGDAMSYVAPQAASMGLSVEETAAAIGKLSDAGIQGERAGTSLRGILTRLSAPTAEATATMEELGVEIFDLEGNMKSLPAIIEEFRVATDGMTQQQEAAALGAIFQTRSLTGLQVLLADTGKDLEEYTTLLEESGGTAEEVAGKQLDTLQGQFKILQSAVEGVAIGVGEVLIPPLTTLLRDIIIPFVQKYGPDFVKGLRLVGDTFNYVGTNTEYALASTESLVDKLQAGTNGMEAFAEAQDAYNNASEETQREYAGQISSLEELREQHRSAIQNAYEIARAQGTSSQAYQDALAEANRIGREFEAQSDNLTATLGREVQAREETAEAAQAASDRIAAAAREQALAEARASGDIQGALQLMRESANLTEEQFVELSKVLQDAAEEGAQAFGKAVQTEVSFLEERENAQAAHRQNLISMQSDFESEQAALAAEFDQAETDAQREAIAQQMTDLAQSYGSRRSAAQEAYAAEEQQAAEAYARQQAAQLAHLGQMLIDYTTAQAQMAGITAEKTAEMTAALRQEYGVQTSITDRSFQQMTQSIDAWVANNGENTEVFIEHQGRIRAATTQTQQEVDAAIATMTEQARTQFEAGEIDAQEYAERLRQIPGEAESAAAGTVAALGTIPREITTTWTLKDGSKGGIADVKSRAAAVPQSVTQFDTGNIPGRALGGPVSAGQPYMVGERGPELLVPATNGTVVPAAQTAAMMGGGGVNVGGINVTIQGAVVDNAARLQEMADMIAGKVQGAVWQTMSTALDDVAMQGVL